MEKFATENLILLEFLVDQINMDFEIQKELANIVGETCVSFQFLDNAPLQICEQDFSSKNKCLGTDQNVKSGKSCLFSLTPEQARSASTQFDIYVEIFKKMQPGVLPDTIPVGTSLISIVNLFNELVESITANGETPAAKTLKDCFRITNSKGENVGHISVYIRMSCFGKLIVTQFQMNLEDKSVQFKAKEGHYLFKYNKGKADGKGGRPDWQRGNQNCPQVPCDDTGYQDQQQTCPVGPCPPQQQSPPPCPHQPCPFQPAQQQQQQPPCAMQYQQQQPQPPCAMQYQQQQPQPPCAMPYQQQQQQQPQPPCAMPYQQQSMAPCGMPQMQQATCPQVPCPPQSQMASCPQVPCPPPGSYADSYGGGGGGYGGMDTPCNECVMPQPQPPPDPRAAYQEIGASMGGNALTIRVHKDKARVEEITDNTNTTTTESDDRSCCCTVENFGKKKKRKEPPALPYPACARPQHMQQQLAMRPGVPGPNDPFSFRMGNSGQAPNNNVVVNPPTCINKDGQCFTEISDPNKDIFVLRIGKKSEGVDKKNNLELELCTPKGPEFKPPPKKETRDTQVMDEDFPKAEKGKGGKGKGKGGKGKGGKGKGGKKGKKGKK